MKKTFFIILSIIILCCIGFFIYKSNTNNRLNYSSNYTAQRTYTNETLLNSINNTSPKNNNLEFNNHVISEFSTKLPLSTKSRYSNIKLACNTLNDTIVKSGDTFSLWNVLGSPTKEKGYKKAKSFTSDGKIIKTYGGGICQVSTTIYNAVLDIDGIEITERHEHSRDVSYVKDGKDAAVAYSASDLKFKNNLDYDIKIKANLNKNKVIIKIEKI